MGETFYSILGVGTDADEQTIHRAYREHAKETHPDVSDDPAAVDTFKRLTTARDVLVDTDERTVYDRLGHASYVCEYVESSEWDSTTDPSDRADKRIRTRCSEDQSTAEWWEDLRQARSPGETWTWGETRSRRRRGSTGRQTRSDGGYASESWQTASDVYTRTDSYAEVTSGSTLRERLAALGALGPWLVVHLVLLLSSLATVGFLFVNASSTIPTTVFLFSGSILFISAVLCLSVLHLLIQYYS